MRVRVRLLFDSSLVGLVFELLRVVFPVNFIPPRRAIHGFRHEPRQLGELFGITHESASVELLVRPLFLRPREFRGRQCWKTRRNYFFYAISLFLDLFIGIIITA